MIRAPQGSLLWRACNLKVLQKEWGRVKNDVVLSVRKPGYRHYFFCPCLCRKLSAIRISDIYYLPYGLIWKKKKSFSCSRLEIFMELQKQAIISWDLGCFVFEKWGGGEDKPREMFHLLCLHHDTAGTSWPCTSGLAWFWQSPFIQDTFVIISLCTQGW